MLPLMAGGARHLQLYDNQGCFACGSANPSGLGMKFSLDSNEELRSEFTAEKRFQGFDGILHGGIVALVLDEMMVNLTWIKGYHAVSAEFHVRLKKAVRTGQKITLRSRIVCEEKKLIKTEAQAFLPNGTLAAEARAVCVKIHKPQKAMYTRMQ